MQYVNDDMDELFKRAAENYPLDTKSADWNKVLAAMQNESSAKSEDKGKKNSRFLWLLLLLPMGLICNQLYSPSILNEEAFKIIKAGDDLSDTISNQQKDVYNKRVNTITVNDDGGDGINLNGIHQQREDAVPNEIAAAPGFSPQSKKNVYLPEADLKFKTQTYSSFDDAFPFNQKEQSRVSTDNFINEELFSGRIYVTSIAHRKKPLDGFSTSVKRTLAPLLQSPDQETNQNIRVAKRKRLYIGLMGGIDATTIKFQKIEDAGSSYGILFGYQLNKKWSIETGAYLERKYYYTDGKYLNTSKMYIPPTTWIDDASGDCKMIEVPLVVKYNFSNHKNSDFFAAVGTSSYIMKKEDYTYRYYYGTAGPVSHKKEYKNSSTNLFSALSISGGYTHHVGSFGEVRVEPYVKLPVARMGIGKLPFFSAGLQVGVTKKF